MGLDAKRDGKGNGVCLEEADSLKRRLSDAALSGTVKAMEIASRSAGGAAARMSAVELPARCDGMSRCSAALSGSSAGLGIGRHVRRFKHQVDHQVSRGPQAN